MVSDCLLLELIIQQLMLLLGVQSECRVTVIQVEGPGNASQRHCHA